MGYSIKQHGTVEYLGCQIDSKLPGEAFASKVQRKINAKLKFIYRKSIYLILTFRRLLEEFLCLECNSLIQPQFDKGCSSWFLLLKENLNIKLQKAQNKYICFCVNSSPRFRIDLSPFRKIKLRPARDRVEYCIVNTDFKY